MQKEPKSAESIQNPPKSALLRCWESAVSSQNARFMAIPDGQKEPDIGVARNSDLSVVKDMMKRMEAGETSFTENFMATSQTLGKAEDTRRAAVGAGEQIVLDQIKSGQLRSFAFEKPRSLKDDPVELAWQMINGNPNFSWDFGTLHKDSLSFVEVRFLEAHKAGWILNASQPVEHRRLSIGEMLGSDVPPTAPVQEFTPSNPVGRPSVSRFIQDALLALDRAGEIDYTKSMTSHYPLIRRWLACNHPDLDITDRKPGNEAMRRVVSPFFEAQKI